MHALTSPGMQAALDLEERHLFPTYARAPLRVVSGSGCRVFDDTGRELVGYEAQRQQQLNPKNTVFGAKRLIGVSAEAEMVQEMRKRVTFPIEDQ